VNKKGRDVKITQDVTEIWHLYYFTLHNESHYFLDRTGHPITHTKVRKKVSLLPFHHAWSCRMPLMEKEEDHVGVVCPNDG